MPWFPGKLIPEHRLYIHRCSFYSQYKIGNGTMHNNGIMKNATDVDMTLDKHEPYDDFWDFMPPLAICLSTLAVLAVVFFIIYLCFCKKENEDEPPLVKSNTESENMEWSEQKNMAYNKF